MKFKPTPEQIAIIKQCAVIETGGKLAPGAIILEPGIRVNTEEDKGYHMNIALVTNESDSWEDTDLHDYGFWADFRKGVELDPNGRGIFDFYLRKRTRFSDGELLSNITVYVIGGKMSYIEGVGSADPIWRREGGFGA